MENTLRDPAQLAEAQRGDPSLGPIRAMLEAGKGDGTEYVLADDRVAHAQITRAPATARQLRQPPGGRLLEEHEVSTSVDSIVFGSGACRLFE